MGDLAIEGEVQEVFVNANELANLRELAAAYEEAMHASNEAGCVGMSAAETIRFLYTALPAAIAAPYPKMPRPNLGPVHCEPGGKVTRWAHQYKKEAEGWYLDGVRAADDLWRSWAASKGMALQAPEEWK